VLTAKSDLPARPVAIAQARALHARGKAMLGSSSRPTQLPSIDETLDFPTHPVASDDLAFHEWANELHSPFNFIGFPSFADL
jgi:hypothetical protein